MKIKMKVVHSIRSALVTMSLSVALMLSETMTLESMINPPVIPQNVEANAASMEAVDDPKEFVDPLSVDETAAIDLTSEAKEEDSAYLPLSDEGEAPVTLPQDVEEDDLHAPEGFAAEGRKELFYTFLIVGTDGGINTDTIMVASYDGVHKEANIIGIPRDSLVNVARRVKKINAAYPAGTLHGGGHEGGIEQLRKEIKSIVGFVPDFYVCVDLEAFTKIIDTIGGVDIDVPFDMVYDDPSQNLHINIKQGQQHLDGKDALRFARYRKGNHGRATISDYERIANQQTVIKAVLSKLLKPANILKIPEFIEIFNAYVRCDISLENMLWFADQLNQIRGTDALTTYTMPTTGTSGQPNYYELLDEPAIVELVNQTINPYANNIQAVDLDIIGGY